jgi:foldase protein PrsA
VALGLAIGRYGQAAPGPAALVNGEPISRQELHDELMARFGPEVLNDLVNERLIAQEARARGVVVPEAEIQAWVEDIKGSPEAQSMIASGRLDEARIRRNLRAVVPLYHLILQNIPESQRRLYFEQHRQELEQVRASHILLATREEAERVRRELAGAGDFARAAAEHSLDVSTRQRGGDLGFFGRGDLDPAITQAAFGLQVGEISQPVPTRFGYHLLLVTARRSDYASCSRRVMAAMASERTGEYLSALRRRSTVESELWPPAPQGSPSPGLSSPAE